MRIRKGLANGSSVDVKFSKTQLSKTVQSGGFVMHDPLGIFGSFSPLKIINSIANSYLKELHITIPKKLNNNLLEDAGLNIFGKRKSKK